MSTHSERLRQEILALQPALLKSAIRLTGDTSEANNLVRLTMAEAFAVGEARADDAGDTSVWVFGILRGTFHSVARRRAVRQDRGHHAVQRQIDRNAAEAVLA
jgi:DNA-directed RNA polymerase specialized sigma24 family protein